VPFQYLLTNLMVDLPGAEGAIFVDPEGECVDYVTRKATPYELKVEGAYHGLFLRRASGLAVLAASGALRQVAIAGTAMCVMSRPLNQGYYLVLVMEPGTPLSLAANAMAKTGEALNREII